MSDGIVYRWLTEADLKEIVRRETETLRALLAEARNWAVAVQDDSLRQRIDAALAAMTEKP